MSTAIDNRGAEAALAISLGLSDFRKMRAPGIHYADKSHLIRSLLDVSDQARYAY